MTLLIDKEQTSGGDTPIAGGSFEDEDLGGDVVLVHMPFASLNKPSLGLGCLAGALRQAGNGVVYASSVSDTNPSRKKPSSSRSMSGNAARENAHSQMLETLVRLK